MSTASCTICLSALLHDETRTALVCGHTLHAQCVAQWRAHCEQHNSETTCPVCRTVVFPAPCVRESEEERLRSLSTNDDWQSPRSFWAARQPLVSEPESDHELEYNDAVFRWFWGCDEVDDEGDDDDELGDHWDYGDTDGRAPRSRWATALLAR